MDNQEDENKNENILNTENIILETKESHIQEDYTQPNIQEQDKDKDNETSSIETNSIHTDRYTKPLTRQNSYNNGSRYTYTPARVTPHYYVPPTPDEEIGTSETTGSDISGNNINKKDN
jgi:hypothetical protein